VLEKLKLWASATKRDAHAIYLAAPDPRVPWYAKALALCMAGYALSPIDLRYFGSGNADFSKRYGRAIERPVSRDATFVIVFI
jgi:hypothetical protein